MPDKFEIVFSFDTTGSMYSCLEEVRNRLSEIVQELNRKIPGIRIAIFAHGDYCDAGNYVTKYIDFTNREYELVNFVRTVGKTSGGDAPECYELVMREVQEKLSWSSDSQKALVLIGDAPPHEADEEQNYRNLDWREEARRLRDRNIRIYAVECHGRSYEFYQHIASQTFGFHMPLSNINNAKQLLLDICFREAGLVGTASFSPVAIKPSSTTTPTPSTSTSTSTSLEILGDMDLGDFDSDDDDTVGIRCDVCDEVKLANEFPSETVSEECKHHLGVCMRCVVSHVQRTRRCPQAGCDVAVDPGCQQMKIIEATLDTMFLDYANVLAENRKLAFGTGADAITVSTMNGDTAWVKYQANMTVTELKREVETQLQIKEASQKIIYKDRVLKATKGPGQPFRLSDFGIQKNDDLSLIVPLYCIPDDLDHVVFDLSWEFPRENPDFLDASCLTFKGSNFVQVIDWNHSTNTYYLKDAIRHSAKNETHGGGKFGRQTIHVHLKRLPFDVTHLYFTLSSWRSDNLSAFNSPSLNFYDASSPEVNLCSTTFTHALSHQAVVMCSVVRVGSQWQIFECDAGGCVNGNAKKYNPIRERIVHLIENER